MKKILFLMFLLFTLSAPLGIQAENIDPEILLRNADSDFFPKAGFIQKYDKAITYTNEFLTEDVLHQSVVQEGTGIDVLTTLHPSQLVVRTTNKHLKFDDYRAKDFHAGILLHQAESVPAGGGYCWLRYSDAAFTGPGAESGVILYPGGKAYSFSKQNGETVYQEIADLSSVDPSERIKIDVIRLDGISYFYFDGSFSFQYEDGMSNPVSFEAGSELNEGGNRIRCVFDNFTYRKQ